ncbi:MAG: hypothetical protein U1B79_00625 [Candidatus Pacearchaeota archaeon]|nr:hypothetical protein [Nanoarchaeota archaeon]MDZ4226598.1 hypothetical protein [Candidatus Pacearchaeota archaeon]
MFWQWDVWNNMDVFWLPFFIGLFAILYAYVALALMAIARKTKTKNAWLAWIPIANFYLLTQMARKSGHWTWILLLGFLPFGGTFITAVGIWFFWRVAERIKFPGWVSLFLLIPFVNLIVLGVLAWSKK